MFAKSKSPGRPSNSHLSQIWCFPQSKSCASPPPIRSFTFANVSDPIKIYPVAYFLLIQNWWNLSQESLDYIYLNQSHNYVWSPEQLQWSLGTSYSLELQRSRCSSLEEAQVLQPGLQNSEPLLALKTLGWLKASTLIELFIYRLSLGGFQSKCRRHF